MSGISWTEDGPTCALSDMDGFEANSDDMQNTMLTPNPDVFQLRGKNYLKDKKKFDAERAAFQLTELKVYAHTANLLHVAHRIKTLKKYLEAQPDHEFVIVNRMLPTTPILNVIEVFRRSKESRLDETFEKLFADFKNKDDEFRNLRLKYLVKIPNASWMVRTTVGALGGFRPVIMGKGYLKQEHFMGANYYEVDVDIGTSRVARGVTGVILPQQRKLIIDEGFVIEGQGESELPERLLCSVRGVRLDLYSLGIRVTDDKLNIPLPEDIPKMSSTTSIEGDDVLLAVDTDFTQAAIVEDSDDEFHDAENT